MISLEAGLVQCQGLAHMVLMGPFQPRVFCDYEIVIGKQRITTQHKAPHMVL